MNAQHITKGQTIILDGSRFTVDAVDVEQVTRQPVAISVTREWGGDQRTAFFDLDEEVEVG